MKKFAKNEKVCQERKSLPRMKKHTSAQEKSLQQKKKSLPKMKNFAQNEKVCPELKTLPRMKKFDQNEKVY
jgi:hypothetical protein